MQVGVIMNQKELTIVHVHAVVSLTCYGLVVMAML